MGQLPTLHKSEPEIGEPMSRSGSGLYLEGRVSGKPCKLLVDTGAQVSILSNSLWETIEPQGRLTPYEGSVRAANGSLLGVLGTWSTFCEVDQLALACNFIIVDSSSQQAILGTDFLIKYRAVVDVARQKCKLLGKELPLVCVLSKDHVCRVTLSDDITLPARSEVILEGKIEGICEGPNVGIFEPADTLASKYDLLVARVVSAPTTNRIPLRAVNVSPEPMVLHRGTHVGQFELDVSVLDKSGLPERNGCEWGVEALESELHLSDRGLNDAQRKAVKVMLHNNLSVFSSGEGDLGRTRMAYHRIETGQNRPVKMHPRKVPVHFESEMETQLGDMQAQGVIRPSQSPWAAPVVMVRKKDGGLRFCVDYRRLNDLTVKDAYPLPRIDDTLDALGASKWFSTLDLASGYWQVELDPRHREKSAFVTKHGLFEFNVLPFGLCNAPSTFQRLMELVLADLQWMTCLVYLDDIIVFGRSFEEHVSRLGEVLGRLKAANLKVKPTKCTLFSKQVSYLGHIISEEGVGTDPAKIETVRSWPAPTCVAEVRSFVGLASYYRRFIAGFAAIAQPLHKLTEKNSTFQWDTACQEAFDTLKQKLITAPILAYPDPAKQFVLDTDASDQGIGAVLSQVHGEQERVVAYASRSLSRSERNYATTRKELLAVVAFTHHFRHFLLGQEFLLRTDHSSLQWLHNFKEPEGQVARWLEKLSSYQYRIQHRPGKQHNNADALSRRIVHCNVASSDKTDQPTSEKLSNRQQDDPILSQLIALKAQINRGSAIDVQSYPELRPYRAVWDSLYIDRGGVLRYKDSSAQGEGQRVLSKAMVPFVLHDLHNSKTGGHLGVEKLLDRVRSRFYWPGWTQDVKEWCRSCQDCAATKVVGPTPRAPLQTSQTSRPFERVAMDILGPLPTTERNNRYILVLADYFTKWAEAFPIANMEAKTVADVFITQFVLRFGVPRTLHTDQGRNFESLLFQEVCELLEMNKTRTTPYHPQSDGLVERLNKTLATMLSNFVNANQSDWDILLPYVMMAYRGSVQSSTKYTPYEAVMGQQIVLPVDVLMDQCREGYPTVDEYVHNVRERLRTVGAAIQRHQQVASQSQKEFYDLRVSHQYYEPGERVWVRDKRRRRGQCPKLMKRFAGPYVVTERLSDILYRLRGGNGNMVVHFNRLKPCYDSGFRLGPVDPNAEHAQNDRGVEIPPTSHSGERETGDPDEVRPPPVSLAHERNCRRGPPAPRPTRGRGLQPSLAANPGRENRRRGPTAPWPAGGRHPQPPQWDESGHEEAPGRSPTPPTDLTLPSQATMGDSDSAPPADRTLSSREGTDSSSAPPTNQAPPDPEGMGNSDPTPPADPGLPILDRPADPCSTVPLRQVDDECLRPPVENECFRSTPQVLPNCSESLPRVLPNRSVSPSLVHVDPAGQNPAQPLHPSSVGRDTLQHTSAADSGSVGRDTLQCAPTMDSGPVGRDTLQRAPAADSGPVGRDTLQRAPTADSGSVGKDTLQRAPTGNAADMTDTPRRPRREIRLPKWLRDFDVDVNTVGCVDAILFKGGGSVMEDVYWPPPTWATVRHTPRGRGLQRR